jgi:hypothetical protein
MLERSILALRDKPIEYLFKGILLALLIGKVKSITRLLVKTC